MRVMITEVSNRTHYYISRVSTTTFRSTFPQREFTHIAFALLHVKTNS